MGTAIFINLIVPLPLFTNNSFRNLHLKVVCPAVLPAPHLWAHHFDSGKVAYVFTIRNAYFFSFSLELTVQ